VAFLNWSFGLTKDDRLEDRGGTHPRICGTWLPPQKLSSPSQSLYMDMGMVMMQKKRVPRDEAMDGSKGSVRPTKSDSGVKLGVPTSS
jgi:hypothetical protein